MRPLILIVLDGWGINQRKEGNAQALARMPFVEKIFREFPHSRLETSGLSVGLPEGQMEIQRWGISPWEPAGLCIRSLPA